MSGVARSGRRGPWISRLDKALSHRGAGTRSQVLRLIAMGKVTDDKGNVMRSPSVQISELTPLHVQGIGTLHHPPLLYAYYKPVGIHAVMKDPWNRPCLTQVPLPQTIKHRYHPVGRLDADSSGLFFFSSNGDVTKRMLDPAFKVEREYLAIVDNPPVSSDALEQLKQGVHTRHSGTHAAEHVELVGENAVKIVVTEGKYRQVRRMLANVGHPVKDLVRTRVGPLTLEMLGLAIPGELEEVPRKDLLKLWKHFKDVAPVRGPGLHHSGADEEDDNDSPSKDTRNKLIKLRVKARARQ